MKNLTWIGVVFVAFLWNCKQASPAKSKEPPPAVTLEGIDTFDHQLVLDLLKLAEQKALPKLDTLEVLNDPEFHNAPKKYLGFLLTDLLKMAFDQFKFDTTNSIVHFECNDGYTPTTPLSMIYGKNIPFIAVHDLEAPSGKDWVPGLEKMGPYYLVWHESVPQEHRYVYPYGLIKIKVLSLSKEFKNVYPTDNADVVRGFDLFSQNCMKCHAVNKVGGVMGPEFNIPKNITEYWAEENIIAFAKNPQSFRRNSRMYAIQGLKDADFQEIVKYLKYMSKHKIAE